MKAPPPVQRIPWPTIGLVLAGTAVAAWGVGFLVWLILRFGFGA